MATLTIGTASGGFFNFRGTNSTPYAMGSSVVIQNTGGDINTTGGYEGVVFSQLTFQAAANSGTSTFYGNVWNSSGTSITNSPGVSSAADTAAPFTSKTFNLSDQYFATPQTVYVGFSRAAGDDCNWDVVNGNNTTRVSNSSGSAPSGLTLSGTGTIYRRLVGTATYTLYDAGNISQSASQTSNLTVTLTFAGNSPTYGKNISINWGDGTTTTTVAAGATPATQIHTYATAGAKTITTTLSHASTSVGIPNITLTSNITVKTVPGQPTGLTVTPGTADTGGVTQAVATWTAPASDPAVTTYQYSFDNTNWTSTASTSTTFTITGLNKYTDYNFYIRARNIYGVGAASTVASFKTFGGRYAVYNGTTFVDKYAQKYNGSTWSDAPIREYNGTIWDYTDR